MTFGTCCTFEVEVDGLPVALIGEGVSCADEANWNLPAHLSGPLVVKYRLPQNDSDVYVSLGSYFNHLPHTGALGSVVIPADGANPYYPSQFLCGDGYDYDGVVGAMPFIFDVAYGPMKNGIRQNYRSFERTIPLSNVD